jgi:membrane-bound lytic murein transglycosylase B
VERVIELDRRQPEFTQPFTEYYNPGSRASGSPGAAHCSLEHRDLLAQVQRDYGVPAHYLVAFWGLETNFGSYFGDMPVPDSLATLACDPAPQPLLHRRADGGAAHRRCR